MIQHKHEFMATLSYKSEFVQTQNLLSYGLTNSSHENERNMELILLCAALLLNVQQRISCEF